MVLASQDGKIVCENTLDARLEVIFRQKLPEVCIYPCTVIFNSNKKTLGASFKRLMVVSPDFPADKAAASGKVNHLTNTNVFLSEISNAQLVSFLASLKP